eukprot:101717_1
MAAFEWLQCEEKTAICNFDLNDLRKIGKTFLPPNISTISSKQIHGRCLLQIMSIRNCNTPSTNQDRAASSSSHLVSMALTDGFVKCNAVEDYPIDAFRRKLIQISPILFLMI